jgi:hypothetical protein
MVEETQTGEDHRHAVFVTGGNDIFITVGATGL